MKKLILTIFTFIFILNTNQIKTQNLNNKKKILITIPDSKKINIKKFSISLQTMINKTAPHMEAYTEFHSDKKTTVHLTSCDILIAIQEKTKNNLSQPSLFISKKPSYENIQKTITRLYNVKNISKDLILNQKQNINTNNANIIYIKNMLTLAKKIENKKLYKNITNALYTFDALKKINKLPKDAAMEIMSFINLKNLAHKKIFYKNTIWDSKWVKFFINTTKKIKSYIL